MPKLSYGRGFKDLDQMKWSGVDEPQTDEERQEAIKSLQDALRKHQERQNSRQKYNPIHHGGNDGDY